MKIFDPNFQSKLTIPTKMSFDLEAYNIGEIGISQSNLGGIILNLNGTS